MKKQKGTWLGRWTKRRKIIVGVVSAVVIVAIAGLLVWNVFRNQATDINQGDYQAVFLTNGQVYFGKLQPFAGGTMKLTDVFYLQKTGSNDSANPQASSDTGDVQLIKLGSEVHAPQDEMVILRDQVLFYENLKPGGSVAQSIAKYDAAH